MSELDNYMVKDICDMHDKFNVRGWVSQKIKEKDYESLKKLLKFRLDFIKEELDETTDAFDADDPEEIVDGLIDIIVIALGTLDIFQVDIHDAWKEVANANLSKEVGIKESRPNPLGLPDLIKPEGWIGPDHAGNVGLIGTVKVETLNLCKCHSCYMGRGY